MPRAGRVEPRSRPPGRNSGLGLFFSMWEQDMSGDVRRMVATKAMDLIRGGHRRRAVEAVQRYREESGCPLLDAERLDGYACCGLRNPSHLMRWVREAVGVDPLAEDQGNR